MKRRGRPHLGRRRKHVVLLVCGRCPLGGEEREDSREYAFWPVVRLSDGRLYQGPGKRRVG